MCTRWSILFDIDIGPPCVSKFPSSYCRFTNGSRSLGLVGFAASRNKADARHYDLPYLYNPQQVAVVLAIQAIQLFNLKS